MTDQSAASPYEAAAIAGERLSPPSNGVIWGLVSLALDLLEVIVLVEILYFDKAAFRGDGGSGLLQVYFYIMLAATAGQAAGVALAARSWYRLGGALQIVASAVQVFKVDGIIGVVGGVKAWRYPARTGMRKGAD